MTTPIIDARKRLTDAAAATAAVAVVIYTTEAATLCLLIAAIMLFLAELPERPKLRAAAWVERAVAALAAVRVLAGLLLPGLFTGGVPLLLPLAAVALVTPGVIASERSRRAFRFPPPPSIGEWDVVIVVSRFPGATLSTFWSPATRTYDVVLGEQRTPFQTIEAALAEHVRRSAELAPKAPPVASGRVTVTFVYRDGRGTLRIGDGPEDLLDACRSEWTHLGITRTVFRSWAPSLRLLATAVWSGPMPTQLDLNLPHPTLAHQPSFTVVLTR